MDNYLSAVAKEATSNWRIEISELELLPLTENIAFRVTEVSGKRYVLRLHRPGYHSLDELKSEQQWTHALRDADIDVPVPVKTTNGSYYCPVRVCGDVRYAGMLKWINGATMLSLLGDEVDGEIAAKRFFQLGELLAKIHNQACFWKPPENFSRHAFNADGLFGDQPFWGRFWEARLANKKQRQWLCRIRDQLRAVLTRYGESPETYSLIHSDLHPGNVIVNGRQLHIIDFDDAGYGWHQYDLAVSLFDYRGHTEFLLVQNSLFEGYRQHRRLSDQAISYVPLFLVIRALALVGWFSDRPEHDERADITGLVDYAADALERALAACS